MKLQIKIMYVNCCSSTQLNHLSCAVHYSVGVQFANIILMFFKKNSNFMFQIFPKGKNICRITRRVPLFRNHDLMLMLKINRTCALGDKQNEFLAC